MKQILPKLKELNKHLSFAKKHFTKSGFRHFTNYIDGLITINQKSVRQISKASIDENHHSQISYLLNEAKFEQNKLEQRYLKKIKYLFGKSQMILCLDDTLVERNGKKIEETQSHHNHNTNSFLTGHQYFTAILRSGNLIMPLFPQLYSKNTDSKIEMARNLVESLHNKLPLNYVLFDSWYSDKKLISKLITKKIHVICPIKTNRNICIEKWNWVKLSKFSKEKQDYKTHIIDENNYQIASYKTKLDGLPFFKMLVSKLWNEKTKKWSDNCHLISTNKRLNETQIIRLYSKRWAIETFHRDIKQNLGFASAFVRKKTAIVRHAIFVVLAYAVLKLFMFRRKKDMTLGESCEHIQNEEMNGFILEIIEIEDKEERISQFRDLFIRETAKV